MTLPTLQTLHKLHKWHTCKHKTRPKRISHTHTHVTCITHITYVTHLTHLRACTHMHRCTHTEMHGIVLQYYAIMTSHNTIRNSTTYHSAPVYPIPFQSKFIALDYVHADTNRYADTSLLSCTFTSIKASIHGMSWHATTSLHSSCQCKNIRVIWQDIVLRHVTCTRHSHHNHDTFALRSQQIPSSYALQSLVRAPS